MLQQFILKFRMAPVITAAIGVAASTFAQATTVTGTGNPDVDIPAVQAAVNLGGEVVLSGHFSFDKPPTIPSPLQAIGIPLATILISKAVAISGAGDAIIERGTIPFYVARSGRERQHPKGALREPREIRGCRLCRERIGGRFMPHRRIHALAKYPVFGNPVIADDMAVTPSPSQPGHPENLSGRMRRIAGRAHVEGNVITTGPVSAVARPEAIRVVNIGAYVIAHNVIHSQWPDPDAIGIGVFSQVADWPINAEVLDNGVTMSPPDGVQYGNLSAGIDIRRFAHGVFAGNNTIRGRARTAIGVDVFNGGIPGNTALVLNRFGDFDASVAGVIVGDGVSDTLILGQKGTINDHGINTVMLPSRTDRPSRSSPSSDALDGKRLAIRL